MIEAQCNLWGEQFSPNRMMEELVFDAKINHIVEAGQIGVYGRYKDIITPYGACSFLTSGKVDNTERIVWMTDFISKQIDNFRKYGATDIVFHIDWEGLQGNMEFSPLELMNLAELQIPLTISYRNE